MEETKLAFDSVVHYFRQSLEKSHTLSLEADWVSFYKRIWPDAGPIVRVDKACTMQTRGIDRMIWLSSGKQILVDEKCRATDYGDILLEISSVMKKNICGEYVEEKVGWALDDNKHCDFIAYAIPSAKKCYMLPFQLTKEAVRHNLNRWASGLCCGVTWPIDARNNGYFTRSVGVTWGLLSAAIQEQMFRKFGAESVLPKSMVHDCQMEFDW